MKDNETPETINHVLPGFITPWYPIQFIENSEQKRKEISQYTKQVFVCLFCQSYKIPGG
jgi:hypothetical protein